MKSYSIVQFYYTLFLIFIFLNSVFADFDCGQLTVDSIPAFDANFSSNSCIVISDFTAPDCSLPPPSRFEPTIDTILCPGAPVVETPVVDGSQTYYTQIEYAIENCPYDPVLIEIVGTHYLTNSSFVYNSTRNITIRGYSKTFSTPSENITSLVPVTTEVYNATTNTTTNVTTFVEVVTGTTPETFITLQSSVVGFFDFQVIPQNISITLENILFEGCGTDRGVFLSLACPERCGFDDSGFCKGAWFPKNLNVTENNLCTQTGAFFNGTERISYQVVANNDYNDYNGANSVDASYFWLQEEFTIEAWIFPTIDEQVRFAGVAGNYRHGNAGNSRTGWGLFFDAQTHTMVNFRVALPDKREVTCGQVVTPRTWTHVAGVWDHGTLSLYYNGFLVCNATVNRQTPYYGTEARRPFAIGLIYEDRDNGGNSDDYERYFVGIIDEVRLWQIARTAAQIQAEYTDVVATTNPDLVVYMRFDKGPDFFTNYGTAIPGIPSPKVFAHNNFGDNITAVSDCFCTGAGDTCVPTEGSDSSIAQAVTSIYSSDSVDNYEFVYGMVIDPNGNYGLIFLPGVTNTSGTIFNQTVRFIPGRYENTTTFNSTSSFNSTTNITTITNQSTTTSCFIPGVNPSILPPDGNQYSNLTFFVPGWFFNGGQAPYTALNFVPGIFAPPVGNGSLPADYQPGDLVFTPGIQHPDGTFVPYGPLTLQYIFAITMMGGASWSCNKYIDHCTIKPLNIIPTVPPSITEIETVLGCTVSADDIEPTYLNVTGRDPCFVLRDARMAMPPGFETFSEEQAASCTIGPDDIEPTYLDPSKRDPCFVLRDIRSTIPENTTLNCTDGSTPLPEVYMPCLKNQNLTIYDSTFQNYVGPRVICQWACDENVNHVTVRSNFINTPGSAIWVSGMQNYDIHDSNFCPCGGTTEACIYLNANHITAGFFYTYNIRHCAITDLLPIACEYDLTPELKCIDGVTMCLDIVATLQEDCQQVLTASGALLFDDDCAVFTPCQCNSAEQNITLPDGSVVTIVENTGNIEIGIDFVTPLIMSLLNGSDFFVVTCDISYENRTFTYPCTVNVTVQMFDPMLNMTINITVQQSANCSSIQQVAVGSANSVPCPCPSGFNSSLTTNLTGSAAAQALGLYSQCEWPIPNGLPGEECLNGIVQCPYAGGTLGSGTPPPVPIGACDAGVVKISCSSCSGGTIFYENVTQACPAACVNDTSAVFTLPCQCNNFYIQVPCNRDVQCIFDTPCSNFTNVTLCANTGSLLFDGNQYPCFVDENQTQCLGISYAASSPAAPPDGQMKIPCATSYTVPSPGPCSCLGSTTTSATNVTVANNATICNTTIDPNCTNTVPSYLPSTDPALQLLCLPSGQLQCRCDGIYAINPFNGTNFTLQLNSSAIWYDNLPLDGRFYHQVVTTQGLPYGVRFTRADWTVVQKYPLKVQHFYSGHFKMHELGRKGISPQVTGTIADWADGYDYQWNFRTCNQLDPGPDEGVFTNECKQYRPRQKDSCVVDSTFDVQQTPGFGTTRFDRIKDALAEASCKNIIVHKSVNVYEERLKFERSNMWFFSYDEGTIVESAHWIKGDNITIRGFVFLHPATNDFPILQPTTIQDNNFDSTFQGDPGDAPTDFKLYNCRFLGNNVNKAGAIIGLFGKRFDMQFNHVENFQTRSVFVDSKESLLRLNTFVKCTGRAYRTRRSFTYVFEENLLIECRGLGLGKNVEITSFRAQGDLGTVNKLGIGQIVFGNLTAEDYNDQFDTATAIDSIDPLSLGCNQEYDSARTCYVRGNRVKFIDEEESPDFSTICFRIIGGGIPPENVVDNVCSHAKIGMDFSYTTKINFLSLPQLFKQNALIRVQDTYRDVDSANSADFTSRVPGSLVTLGCYFPNCWPNNSFPVMEVNPRHDLIISPFYGFYFINNLTEASRWGKPLNMLRVTSERAILRREQIFFTRDTYAVGIPDTFCCARPIIYGSKHQLFTPTEVVDYVEFRLEIEDFSDDSIGDKLFETPGRYLPLDVRFYRCWFNGRNQIGTGRVRIMNIYMDPYEGVFVFHNNSVFDWWNLPRNTQRGIVHNNNGITPVLILPDDGTLFYTERAPNIDGIYVFFQQTDRTVRSRFVKASKKNPARSIDSIAIITDNTIRDLDGNVLWISTPGNWEITDNRIIDCGSRQTDAIATLYLEGEPTSFGSYVYSRNYMNTTKNLLFPYVGGSANKELHAAIFMCCLRYPVTFECVDNTVALNGFFSGNLSDSWTLFDTDNPPLEGNFDFGFFKKGGVKFFNAPKVNAQTPTPNPLDAEKIAQRPLVMTRQEAIASTNYDPDIGTEQDPDSFDDPIQKLLPLSKEDILTVFKQNTNVQGYPIAFRTTLPPQVIIKTVNPARVNASIGVFFQRQLYPYRELSAVNGDDVTVLLANGNYTTQFRYGPGFHGVKDDIVACKGDHDSLQKSFAACIICNDGCPVILPDACYVHPGNESFVPENPYFGTWFFNTLNDALFACKNPKKVIKINFKDTPYEDAWDFEFANWTVEAADPKNPPIIKVNVPILINADNIAISGFYFSHNVGADGPTFTVGSVIDHDPEKITLTNNTFDGVDTTQSAIVGKFESIAIIGNLFKNYDSTNPEVDLTSSCGMLFFNQNMFVDVKGNALRASNYDVSNIVGNAFENCGYATSESDPYCVYISNCFGTSMTEIFKKNTHFALGYTYTPGTTRRAAFWLDTLELANKNVSYDFEFNEANGLDIGMRITNADDLSSGATFGGLRATVSFMSIRQRNQDVTGKWHYLVWGPPSDDINIENNPEATTKFYCDNDCGGSYNDVSLIIASASGLGLLILICILYTPRLPNYYEQNIAYSFVVHRDIALDPALLPDKRFPPFEQNQVEFQ